MKRITIISILFVLIGSAIAADIATVLSSISGKYDIIWAYNTSDTKDPWKKYIPSAPDAVNDLKSMVPGLGYWISINSQSAVLTINGTVLDSLEIPVYTGWNLIGYPLTQSKEISTAISSISGKYEIVWAYNASDTDHWKRYAPGAEVGNDLTYMTPGSGYWIKMNQDATLVISN